MKKIALALFATSLMVGAAQANQCPTMVKAIDEALATSQLSDEDKAKVVELRNEGEALHQAGKHDESVAKLSEAEKMLGM